MRFPVLLSGCALFVSIAASASAQTDNAKTATPALQTVVPQPKQFDFEVKKTALEVGWLGVTDTIMQGKSKVAVSLSPDGAGGSKQSLKLEGSVILGANPYVMFAGGATRFYQGKNPVQYDVSGFTGVKFWAKGDGNTYRIDLPCAAVTDYMFHSFSFTPPTGEWREYKIPFVGFKQMPYGKKVQWSGTDVTGIQFFTVGGPIEKFTLLVDEIQLYK